MSIYHLKRRLRRGVRACDDLKTFGDVTYVELANVLGVHGICKTEVLARLYVGRSMYRKRLRMNRNSHKGYLYYE